MTHPAADQPPRLALAPTPGRLCWNWGRRGAAARRIAGIVPVLETGSPVAAAHLGGRLLPVDRGRPGSRHHLIREAGGIPLAVGPTGGNRDDIGRRGPGAGRVRPASRRGSRWQVDVDERSEWLVASSPTDCAASPRRRGTTAA